MMIMQEHSKLFLSAEFHEQVQLEMFKMFLTICWDCDSIIIILGLQT